MILGTRGQFAFDGEVREKRLDLGNAHRVRVPFTVKQDEARGPIDVGLLGANGVMQQPRLGPELIQQLQRLRCFGILMGIGHFCVDTAIGVWRMLV